MRRHLIPVLGTLIAVAVTATLAQGGPGKSQGTPARSYAIGLWGDVPYSDEQETVGVPNLIADMNGDRLAFTVHDGDIKAGGSRCDDEVYSQMKAYLNSLEAPALYTPGDNEWTDCDRPAAGGFSSFERLEHLRATLFADPGRSLGQDTMPLEYQAPPYVENARWRVGRVTYATLHVVGSDNNLGDVAPDPAEWAARDAATNEWLRETFDEARSRRSAGVLLVTQANPGFDQSDATRAPLRDPATLEPRDGFFNFLQTLREEAIAFRKPVVLVHGDSHYFRIDKPLQDAQGRRLENFTRLETPGDNAQTGNNDVHWVKVVVNPRAEEVFSFQPQVVEGNRVAVPAP
jgi:hypothetical protein